MAELIVETENLTRKFGDRIAVMGLNIHISEGTIFGLIGPNGAGKSTTTRMLTTVLSPTSGVAHICGLDIATQSTEIRRVLGYILQEKGVRHLLTGREAVEFEATLYHVPHKLRAEHVEYVLDIVGLLPDADRLVSEYSGGMVKRLDLACGLLNKPKLLVLDEPTLALDVASRQRIWDHLALLRGEGVSILLATNYLDEAEHLCDEISILRDGRQVLTGTPADLKNALKGDTVCIDTANPGSVREAIEPFPGIYEIQILDGSRLIARVDNAVTAIPHIMMKAHQRGLRLDSIVYQQPTLAEVFLRHTGAHNGSNTDEDIVKPRIPPATRNFSAEAKGLRPVLQEISAFLRRSQRETTRERLNFVLTIVQPAIWLVLLGSALGRVVDTRVTGTGDYVAFMLPGVIIFLVLGVSVGGAIPLIWDRETGYLQKLLSMPIARGSLLFSRLIFQTGLSIFEAVVALLVAFLLGVRPAAGYTGLLVVLVIVALLTLFLASLLIALAFSLRGHNTFFAVSSFITLPLLFGSTAFVPAAAMPRWLRTIAEANPLSVAIDSIRGLVLDGWRGDLWGQLSLLAVFAAVGICLAEARFAASPSIARG